MSAENPADVIEQAAKVLRHVTLEQYPDAADSYEKWARALAEAGLLADPADRVGSYGQPTYEDLRTACHLLGERLKRAEAEVARLRKLVEELGGTA